MSQIVEDYLNDKASVYKFLDYVQEVLKQEDKSVFDNLIGSLGDQLLKKLFSNDPFKDEILKNSKSYTAAICVICSDACRQLEVEKLAYLQLLVPQFVVDNPEPVHQQTLVNIFECYCRALSQTKQPRFEEPPIEYLLQTLQNRCALASLSQLQVEQQAEPDVVHLVQLLSLFLIFDQCKILFVAHGGFEACAPLLAAAESPHLISALLSLCHSCVFNLNDDSGDQEKSIYDVVSGSFSSIDPAGLLAAAVEKLQVFNAEGTKTPEANFSAFMFIHDCLLPCTRGIASADNYKFCISQMEQIQNDVELQVCLENIIKILSLNPENAEIASLGLEKLQFFVKLLNITETVQIASLIVNIVQLCAIGCGHKLLGGTNEATIQLPDLQPFLKWAFNFSKLLTQKQSLCNSVDQLETCCSVMVFLQEAFGAQYKQLAAFPEACFLLQLAVVLNTVDGLLETVPAFLALLAQLCTNGLIQNYMIAMKQSKNPIFQSDLVKFLLNVCVLLHSLKSGDVVIKQFANAVNENKDFLKGFEDVTLMVKFVEVLKTFGEIILAKQIFSDIKYVDVVKVLQ